MLGVIVSRGPEGLRRTAVAVARQTLAAKQTREAERKVFCQPTGPPPET